MVPRILKRSEHCISRKNIDRNALRVLYRLNRLGFKAYLVGGGVRDSLLKRVPKDFDVVTNAHPSKIKRVFRNSVLIGRRFRLVHVIFKDYFVEVSTFRRTPDSKPDNGDLMLRRENFFGTPEEDALRRDFTVNALFYNIADFTVIDYVGGLDDIENRIIRTIGDPEVRFQEDPARMIRAIRIAGRIKFRIEDATWQAIKKYRDHIMKCSPARILEEIYHLLKYGAAENSIKLLHKSGLMETIMPCLCEYWNESLNSQNPPTGLLRQMDMLPLDSPFHSNPLMLAALYYPLVVRDCDTIQPGMDLRSKVETTLQSFARRFTLPRRHFDRLTQICLAQRWFLPNKNRRFRPKSFIARNFFGETFALAIMQMNAYPHLWKGQKEVWRERIKNSDVHQERRQLYLDLINFKPNRKFEKLKLAKP